jgi:hypothetical protein
MWRRALRTTATAALLLVVGAACAGSKGNHNAAISSSPGASLDRTASTTTSTPPAVKTTATTINKTVWFAGFKLTVRTATLKTDPDAGAGTVDLAVTFNNQGSDPVRFDGQVNLGWGGSNDKFDITTLPTVPAGASSDTTLTFSVDDLFTFNAATLTIGATDHHQAVIPLGLRGELIDLAPIRVGLSGSVIAGNFKATITGAELRADVARSHLELDRGKEALFLSADIAWGGASSYTLGRNNFALALPNGSQVIADEGPSDILNPGATRTNETVRFTVPQPASGPYQLIVRDPTANGAQGVLPFVMAVNDASN